jgi:hypothetical protein
MQHVTGRLAAATINLRLRTGESRQTDAEVTLTNCHAALLQELQGLPGALRDKIAQLWLRCGAPRRRWPPCLPNFALETSAAVRPERRINKSSRSRTGGRHDRSGDGPRFSRRHRSRVACRLRTPREDHHIARLHKGCGSTPGSVAGVARRSARRCAAGVTC